MSIEFGARVKTPSGEEGTVAQEWVHDTLRVTIWQARNKRTHEAYPVLLESGELRFFLADALTELE